jgi:hypothetical protein
MHSGSENILNKLLLHIWQTLIFSLFVSLRKKKQDGAYCQILQWVVLPLPRHSAICQLTLPDMRQLGEEETEYYTVVL